MSEWNRFINRTTFKDGNEVTSSYDKKTGLIYSTVVPRGYRPSLTDLLDHLGIDLNDDALQVPLIDLDRS